VRRADLTIVTNEALAALAAEWGGRPFILPDRIPRLPFRKRLALPGRQNVVFIYSQGEDEPIREVLEAAATVPNIEVYITGNSSEAQRKYEAIVPSNVHWTGYLPEEDYQGLLASCDAVLALTTAPNTLLCGAYEAVALGKALVLSKQEALAAYFSRGRILTDHTDLAMAIRQALDERPCLEAEMRSLRAELEESWSKRWAVLCARISTSLVGRGVHASQGPETMV